MDVLKMKNELIFFF